MTPAAALSFSLLLLSTMMSQKNTTLSLSVDDNDRHIFQEGLQAIHGVLLLLVKRAPFRFIFIYIQIHIVCFVEHLGYQRKIMAKLWESCRIGDMDMCRYLVEIEVTFHNFHQLEAFGLPSTCVCRPCQQRVDVNEINEWNATALYYAAHGGSTHKNSSYLRLTFRCWLVLVQFNAGHQIIVEYLLNHGARCEENTFQGVMGS